MENKNSWNITIGDQSLLVVYNRTYRFRVLISAQFSSVVHVRVVHHFFELTNVDVESFEGKTVDFVSWHNWKTFSFTFRGFSPKPDFNIPKGD